MSLFSSNAFTPTAPSTLYLTPEQTARIPEILDVVELNPLGYIVDVSPTEAIRQARIEAANPSAFQGPSTLDTITAGLTPIAGYAGAMGLVGAASGYFSQATSGLSSLRPSWFPSAGDFKGMDVFGGLRNLYPSNLRVSAPQALQDLGGWIGSHTPEFPSLGGFTAPDWLKSLGSGASYFLPEVRVLGSGGGTATPVANPLSHGEAFRRAEDFYDWGDLGRQNFEQDFGQDWTGGIGGGGMNGMSMLTASGTPQVPARRTVPRIGPLVARNLGISVQKLYEMIRKWGPIAVGGMLGLDAVNQLRLAGEAMKHHRRGGGISAAQLRTTRRTVRKIISMTKSMRELCGSGGFRPRASGRRFGKKCR